MSISFPPSYRQEFLNIVSKLVLRGESMLIFGPPGIGKTTDVQLLLTDEGIKKFHFGSNPVESLVINADETINESLLLPIKESASPHIVIVIDHINRLISSNLCSFFSTIRALRELTRPRICVIALSDENLLKATSLGAIAPIQSLLWENLIVSPALTLKDASTALKVWENYYQAKLKPSEKESVLTASGGIPRLIKRFVKLAADNADIQSIIANPQQDPKLKLDLEKMAVFNRENPDHLYKIPLLSKLEKTTKTDCDQVGSVQFHSRLSKQEYNLANLLISKGNEFVSREEMIEAIWKNQKYDVNEHALDQMLHRLRQKLADAIPKCELEVYRGRGVKLAVDFSAVANF